MELNYQAIFRGFSTFGIDYLVVGGLAVNFHGVPRMTYDIDLMILLEPQNIIRLVSRLTEWGYKPKIPVDPRDLADERKRNSWIQDKGMKALNFYSEKLPIGEIDIVLESPISYQELKDRSVKIDLGEIQVPLISIQDLIELKARAGREQDLADVKHLRRILEK
ncbi:MAG: nucleotidyl transferase AbiEii/AbiGii toxin family protein [Thermodesulfobacteriota bacterium]